MFCAERTFGTVSLKQINEPSQFRNFMEQSTSLFQFKRKLYKTFLQVISKKEKENKRSQGKHFSVRCSQRPAFFRRERRQKRSKDTQQLKRYIALWEREKKISNFWGLPEEAPAAGGGGAISRLSAIVTLRYHTKKRKRRQGGN